MSANSADGPVAVEQPCTAEPFAGSHVRSSSVKAAAAAAAAVTATATATVTAAAAAATATAMSAAAEVAAATVLAEAVPFADCTLFHGTDKGRCLSMGGSPPSPRSGSFTLPELASPRRSESGVTENVGRIWDSSFSQTPRAEQQTAFGDLEASEGSDDDLPEERPDRSTQRLHSTYESSPSNKRGSVSNSNSNNGRSSFSSSSATLAALRERLHSGPYIGVVSAPAPPESLTSMMTGTPFGDAVSAPPTMAVTVGTDMITVAPAFGSLGDSTLASEALMPSHLTSDALATAEALASESLDSADTQPALQTLLNAGNVTFSNTLSFGPGSPTSEPSPAVAAVSPVTSPPLSPARTRQHRPSLRKLNGRRSLKLCSSGLEDPHALAPMARRHSNGSMQRNSSYGSTSTTSSYSSVSTSACSPPIFDLEVAPLGDEKDKAERMERNPFSAEQMDIKAPLVTRVSSDSLLSNNSSPLLRSGSDLSRRNSHFDPLPHSDIRAARRTTEPTFIISNSIRKDNPSMVPSVASLHDAQAVAKDCATVAHAEDGTPEVVSSDDDTQQKGNSGEHKSNAKVGAPARRGSKKRTPSYLALSPAPPSPTSSPKGDQSATASTARPRTKVHHLSSSIIAARAVEILCTAPSTSLSLTAPCGLPSAIASVEEEDVHDSPSVMSKSRRSSVTLLAEVRTKVTSEDQASEVLIFGDPICSEPGSESRKTVVAVEQVPTTTSIASERIEHGSPAKASFQNKFRGGKLDLSSVGGCGHPFYAHTTSLPLTQTALQNHSPNQADSIPLTTRNDSVSGQSDASSAATAVYRSRPPKSAPVAASGTASRDMIRLQSVAMSLATSTDTASLFGTPRADFSGADYNHFDISIAREMAPTPPLAPSPMQGSFQVSNQHPLSLSDSIATPRQANFDRDEHWSRLPPTPRTAPLPFEALRPTRVLGEDEEDRAPSPFRLPNGVVHFDPELPYTPGNVDAEWLDIVRRTQQEARSRRMSISGILPIERPVLHAAAPTTPSSILNCVKRDEAVVEGSTAARTAARPNSWFLPGQSGGNAFFTSLTNEFSSQEAKEAISSGNAALSRPLPCPARPLKSKLRQQRPSRNGEASVVVQASPLKVVAPQARPASRSTVAPALASPSTSLRRAPAIKAAQRGFVRFSDRVPALSPGSSSSLAPTGRLDERTTDALVACGYLRKPFAPLPPSR